MNTRKFTFAAKIRTVAVAAASASITFAAAPVSAQPLPSYATGSADETIHGTVASIDGAYAIAVRDARGYLDKVTLHQGTIINPTGLTLEPGQNVTILGRTDGNTFAANEIDTPYPSLAALPLYPYGYGNYGYPYPAFGYGYYPGYRVGIGFGRGFGRHGW